jgi:hypothetical protein
LDQRKIEPTAQRILKNSRGFAPCAITKRARISIENNFANEKGKIAKVSQLNLGLQNVAHQNHMTESTVSGCLPLWKAQI